MDQASRETSGKKTHVHGRNFGDGVLVQKNTSLWLKLFEAKKLQGLLLPPGGYLTHSDMPNIPIRLRSVVASQRPCPTKHTGKISSDHSCVSSGGGVDGSSSRTNTQPGSKQKTLTVTESCRHGPQVPSQKTATSTS